MGFVRLTSRERAAWLRRLIGRAPLLPTDALVIVAAGLGLWIAAAATPRPSWAPEWSGWVITGIGCMLILRGVVGLSGAVALVRSLRHPPGWPANRAPRTGAEIDDLLGRPQSVGWEFYLMAGYLIVGRERVEPQYLDHELRHRPPPTERIDDDDVVPFIHEALGDAQRIISNVTEALRPEVQERAFGPPGTPGDPARIKHLADRLTNFYEELIGWAARLRGAYVSDAYRHLADLQTRLVDRSVENYRAFVDAFVADVDGPMTEAIRANGSWESHLTLHLDIDETAVEEINAEVNRIADRNARLGGS